MAKFMLNAAVTVSAYTEVEADTIEEAIKIASDRECELGFNGCGYECNDYWIIDAADGMPTIMRIRCTLRTHLLSR